MKKHCLLLLLLTFYFLPVNGQDTPNWNYPEDPQQNKIAREKNALYSDALQSDDYQTASQHLHWLLENNPNLNESIYINGAKIYENLAESTQDEEKAAEYADSAVLMYDLRIKYFNEREEVLNRKAFSAYKMWRDRQDRYDSLYSVMQEAYEANGDNFWPQNAVAYMDAARRYKLTGGELSDMDIVSLYDALDSMLARQEESGSNAERIPVMREQLDKILAGTISSDCNDIEQNLGSLFRERPDNLKLAKVIITLSLQSNCTDSPVFTQAVEVLQEEEPTPGLARLLANQAINQGNYEKAIEAFESAIELTEDNLKEAEMLLDIAQIYSRQGQKSSARRYALQALDADPNMQEAYNLIGNLYYSSYDECRQNQSRVEDRAVFIAAYEMYQKAGNTSMMAQAREQFPTVSMIFDDNREEGEKITIGCWINQTVTLRAAPRQ